MRRRTPALPIDTESNYEVPLTRINPLAARAGVGLAPIMSAWLPNLS
jgi:hypothetical protein